MSSIPSMSPLELDALEAFHKIKDYLSVGRVKRMDYLGMMGIIRGMIIKLENRKYGCITGRHAGTCECNGKL